VPAVAAPRIASLDLIRGVAVLGILAINMAGFEGPSENVYAPVTHGGSNPALDSAIYTASLVLLEGKMRALFSILFGASMEIFVRRAEDAGRDGHALQLRRLGWLAVFGYLHWLVWWGDILFDYAASGFAALALRRAPMRLLLTIALVLFGAWQAERIVESLPLLIAEQRIAAGTATPQQTSALLTARDIRNRQADEDRVAVRKGLFAQAAAKLEATPLDPAFDALAELGEALPYMLVGIALMRSGFFDGGWSRRHLIALSAAGLVSGSAITFPFAAWAHSHDYPWAAMRTAIGGALGFAHLLMALGYAGLLVLASGRLGVTWLGRRLAATGRMALSNYLGCTLLMTTIFYGWGFGLAGRIGTTGQTAFLALGWTVMLGWSAPWLSRFRQGPLEWLWRCLVLGRKISFAR
jgi:uncharacterized protein